MAPQPQVPAVSQPGAQVYQLPMASLPRKLSRPASSSAVLLSKLKGAAWRSRAYRSQPVSAAT